MPPILFINRGDSLEFRIFQLIPKKPFLAMELYKRKIFLILLLLCAYIAVSFWVPYSKLWFIKDVMENQARLYFASQSINGLRELFIRKAEALDVALEQEDVLIQNINGEVIYRTAIRCAPRYIFLPHNPAF